MTGTVKNYKEVGYGFIVADSNGADVFFHIKQFCGEEAEIYPGLSVSYDMMAGPRGPQAANVTPIGGN